MTRSPLVGQVQIVETLILMGLEVEDLGKFPYWITTSIIPIRAMEFQDHLVQAKEVDKEVFMLVLS